MINERWDRLVELARVMGPANFCEKFWILPTGKPIKFRPWQRIFLDYAFKYFEDTQWFIISAMKKTGKTQMNACLSFWIFLTSGKDLVISSNSRLQSENLVYRMIAGAVRISPVLSEFFTVTTRAMTCKVGERKIWPLAVNSKGNAGMDPDISGTEEWGRQSAEEVLSFGELGTPDSRYVVDSYAGVEGLSDHWHGIVDLGLEQPIIDEEWGIYQGAGMLMIHLEGESDAEMVWPYSQNQLDEWRETSNRLKSPGQCAAHLYNRRYSGSFGLDENEWDALFDPMHTPLQPTKEVALKIGIDAAYQIKSDDIAITGWYSEAGFCKLAFHKIYRGKTRHKEQRLEEIEQYLVGLHRTYLVDSFLYDPFALISTAQRLADKGLPMRKVIQSNQNMAILGSQFLQGIRERRIMLYEDSDWRSAHRGIELKDYSRGGVLFKRQGTKTIDLLISAIIGSTPLLNLAAPMPNNQLRNARIELSKPTGWRIESEGPSHSRVGVGSRFHIPG